MKSFRNNLSVIESMLFLAAPIENPDQDDLDSGASENGLMKTIGLSYSMLRRYLKKLTQNELIELNKGRYTTTEKGLFFLERYNEFKMFHPEIDEINKNFKYL